MGSIVVSASYTRRGKSQLGGSWRGQEIQAGSGIGGGKHAVGGVAGFFVVRAVMDGGIVVLAHFAVEALPCIASEESLRLAGELAPEGVPCVAEAVGGGVEGLGAVDEGGVEKIGGSAAGLVGAEVQAADAAIGHERNPQGLVRLRGVEGGPFLIEPLADGKFVFHGVFAAARGVDEPFVGVFDAQLGIGAGLGEEENRCGVRGAGTGTEEGHGEKQLEKKGFHVIITNMNKSNNTAEPGIARLSLSLPNALAEELDGLVEAKEAASRSALVADLVREAVVEHRSRRGKQEIAGAITLVYDHHARNLQAKLTDIQHDSEGLIVSVMHVHLSHHDCLEVLVVRGPADKVRGLADKLAAVRGVKHGKLTITATAHKE